MNLVVNARDAMPGGGKLTLETANLVLDEAAVRDEVDRPPGEYAMLAVSDSGLGMDATTQARIFEPFFTTKPVHKGTGLGLATVYGIVKRSGGFITVYSEVGHGASFKVYLPHVTDGPEGHGAATPEATASLAGSETILFIEDSDSVRASVRRLLEQQGYRVLEARDGEQALRRSDEHPGPIHLVLSDVVLPGIGGPEAVEQLRGRRPGTKVLYVSGYTAGAIAHRGALPAGAAFLPKPFTTETLLREIRRVLDGPG